MTGEGWLFLFAVLLSAALLFTMVFYIIMFSDLECDYINPIDLCNKLNQFTLPEMAAHAALTLFFLLSGQWLAFLLNAPLVAFNVNKVMKKNHMLDATEIFRTLSQHKKECFYKLGFYLLSFFYYLYRLATLRKLMKEEGVEAYVVPSEDAHSSEYTSPDNQRRTFISGFTGSTGVAVITLQEAHLFTDGRYWIQAEKQLDSNWAFHKVPLVKDWDAWLVDESERSKGIKVGIDATLVQYARASAFNDDLTSTGGSFTFQSRNLVDVAWGKQRPSPIGAPVHVHPLEYSGQPAQEKLSQLASWLTTGGDKTTNNGGFPLGSSYIVNELDQIAWMLNLRGASIPCNPVFPSYLLVKPDGGDSYSAHLYISDKLLAPSSEAYRYVIEDLKVQVEPYESLWDHLSSGDCTNDGSKKLVCGEKVSWAVVNSVGKPKAHILKQSPISFWKAVKNRVEIDGMRRAYLRDGVCWVKWAAWLDEAIRVKGERIDEKSASEALIREREKAERYAGMESYDAISASGENAALPHYETPDEGSRIIDRKTPYLMDAGGQYYDGTIDTTRTVHFGKPTAEQIHAFTRVLQGHIAIDTSVFPKGTTGTTLDVKARSALWRDGMNYSHGTGHGIGSFLNVHEGPQGFSTSSGGAQIPAELQVNMCISNEPGFYEEGHYGIRTESCIVVKSVKTRRDFGGSGTWLGFERLTVVPIYKNLVNVKLLTKEEAKWLKSHNQWCREQLQPLLKDDKRALRWLKGQ
ncbi:hypothetical protein CBS101457_000949 [Exobasidium rhododendri]|nr:hypothetical protein CBS101457_000949 [Exobasidium rhododendri]